jgi:hypothetical protein
LSVKSVLAEFQSLPKVKKNFIITNFPCVTTQPITKKALKNTPVRFACRKLNKKIISYSTPVNVPAHAEQYTSNVYYSGLP